MNIEVRLFGGLRVYASDRGRQFTLELPEGATVQDLLAALGIPPGEVWLVSLDETLVKDDHVLHDGDRVMLVEPVGGGTLRNER